MKSNIGTIDKVFRIVIAAVLGVLYFTHVISGTLGIVLLVFAAIMLVTGVLGFCGLYIPFGINTKGNK
jgi:hypothetical protein